MENMDTIHFRQRINARRRDGQPLRDDEINFITNQSIDLAGSPGMFLNLTYLSLVLTTIDTKYPEQVEWAAKAEQVLSKPANEISTDDAKNVTAKEVNHNLSHGMSPC